MEQFREEIQEMLTDEIVTRFYYQKGAIRSAIVNDRGILKAKKLVKDPELYSLTFSPGKIISMRHIKKPSPKGWVSHDIIINN